MVNRQEMVSGIERLATQDQGNAATEYAVCLALIVLASILAITALGAAISDLFPDLADYIS